MKNKPSAEDLIDELFRTTARHLIQAISRGLHKEREIQSAVTLITHFKNIDMKEDSSMSIGSIVRDLHQATNDKSLKVNLDEQGRHSKHFRN